MNRSSLRLAVLDADEIGRQQTVELLQRLGHWVDIDFDIAQFVGHAQSRLDAVVLEITFLSDQEVEGIAADAVAHACPIVATSSSTSDEVIDKASACHAFAHLVKPFSSDSLSAAVHTAINRCAELSALHEEVVSMRQSLEDRKAIERAKGIVMRSMGNDEAKAFKHMQQLARQSRRPLVEVAYGILAVGGFGPQSDAPASQ
jgi:response regulator NasT